MYGVFSISKIAHVSIHYGYITILVNLFLLPNFITANVRIPKTNTRLLTERKQSITVSKPKIETDISELRGSDFSR